MLTGNHSCLTASQQCVLYPCTYCTTSSTPSPLSLMCHSLQTEDWQDALQQHKHTPNSVSFPAITAEPGPEVPCINTIIITVWFFLFFFLRWVRCSADRPNCSSVSLERGVLLVLRLKHGGDSTVVIDSIIRGLVYVANVQERRCLTNGGCLHRPPVLIKAEGTRTHTQALISPLSRLRNPAQQPL